MKAASGSNWAACNHRSRSSMPTMPLESGTAIEKPAQRRTACNKAVQTAFSCVPSMKLPRTSGDGQRSVSCHRRHCAAGWVAFIIARDFSLRPAGHLTAASKRPASSGSSARAGWASFCWWTNFSPRNCKRIIRPPPSIFCRMCAQPAMTTTAALPGKN